MMNTTEHLSLARLCELAGGAVADPDESAHVSQCVRCQKFLGWFSEDGVGENESKKREEQDEDTEEAFIQTTPH
jgi:hypothetical protein